MQGKGMRGGKDRDLYSSREKLKPDCKESKMVLPPVWCNACVFCCLRLLSGKGGKENHVCGHCGECWLGGAVWVFIYAKGKTTFVRLFIMWITLVVVV
jgi:hypothetical protein